MRALVTKMRKTGRLVAVVASVLVGGNAFGCAAAPETGAAVTEPLDIVLLHTNDNWGETEPCG